MKFTREHFNLKCPCGKVYTPNSTSFDSMQANGLAFDLHTSSCEAVK